jgi:hypothetical protein
MSTTSWSISLLGGTRRDGRWTVPERTVSVGVIGGANLDMTEAAFAGPKAEIVRVGLVGDVRVVVPPGTRVDASGFSLFGGRRVDQTHPPDPAAPSVHITAFTLFGGVSVTDR